MIETPTPRTDEAAGHAIGIINQGVLYCSRQLERELTEANAEIARLKGIAKAQLDELEAVSFALGTNEGHSSVDHIVTLITNLRRAVKIAEFFYSGHQWTDRGDDYRAKLDAIKATLPETK